MTEPPMVRSAKVTTYYYHDIEAYFLELGLITEDESNYFCTHMDKCGASFLPYEVNHEPDDDDPKVHKLIAEHFTGIGETVIFVLPYIGGYVEEHLEYR